MPDYMTREQRALRGISNRSEKPNKDLEKNIQNLNQSVRYMSQMMGVMQSGIDDANRDILQQFRDAIEDLMIIFNIGGGGDTLNLDWGDLGVVLENISSILRFDFLNLPDFDLLGWAQDVWDNVFGQLDIIPNWDDLRNSFIGTYVGSNIVLNFIQNLFAPVRRVVKMFTGKTLWEDATPAEVDQFSDDLKAALSGQAPSSGGQLGGANAIQQITNNINALGQGVAQGVDNVAVVFDTIANIFGTATNAESKAIETQTKLQEIIGSNEAGASGGKSGGDDFERPNSTTLGPNWVTQTMAGDLTLQIEDGNVRLLGGSDSTLAYAKWVGSNDVISDYVQTTMVVGGGWGAAGAMYDYIFARWDGLFSGSGVNTTPLNCWAARLEKSGVVTLFRVLNGSMVEFGSHDIGSTAIGDVMSLRCGSYTDERQITVVYNGEPIISYTDATDVSMMGPAYRKHGFSMFASNVFGVQRPARIASYSFSDIPGGGIILGKGFKYYRTNANTVATPAASLLPTSVFDAVIMSPAIEPPGGSYAWGRGEFIIPIEGWWEFTFTFGGTTPSIGGNGALDVEPRLYYGQGTLNQFIELENQRIPRGSTSSGAVTTGPLVSSIKRYCIVGEHVAPGNGPSGNHMANLTGAADGNRTAFAGILLSP